VVDYTLTLGQGTSGPHFFGVWLRLDTGSRINFFIGVPGPKNTNVLSDFP